MRTILLAVLALVATAWGGFEHWRFSRAVGIGHELAAIAETQQRMIEASGQIARIMDNGASQCAAQGQEPVALCFRLSGGQVVEAKGVCSNNPSPSRANRRDSD